MSSDHLEEPGETPARERGGTHPMGQDPAHRAEPDGMRWRLVFAMILGAILVLLALVVLALYGVNRNDKANSSDQTLGDLAAQVKAACAANPTDARKVFGDVCGKAQVIDQRPAGEKGDPGAKGDTGSQGIQGPPPSAAQVATAVASYCASGRCAGKSPSAAQVASAVATYCNAKGECQGPTGTAGQPGAQGSPGATGPQGIQGPHGDPATSAQIAAAVTAYCGQDSKPCAGTPGKDGKDGRGIADTDCQADGTWLISYTDGTTDTALGPCRIVAPSSTPPR
jgi:hypothetical protein